MKKKSTAAILAFFLGGLGIHRFYLGQSGKGIVYLIFFWTCIPAIIALIDFIVILCMSRDDFNAKYNASESFTSVVKNVGSDSDELQKLFDLKEKGIITEEEFEIKKKAILKF